MSKVSVLSHLVIGAVTQSFCSLDVWINVVVDEACDAEVIRRAWQLFVVTSNPCHEDLRVARGVFRGAFTFEAVFFFVLFVLIGQCWAEASVRKCGAALLLAIVVCVAWVFPDKTFHGTVFQFHHQVQDRRDISVLLKLDRSRLGAMWNCSDCQDVGLLSFEEWVESFDLKGFEFVNFGREDHLLGWIHLIKYETKKSCLFRLISCVFRATRVLSRYEKKLVTAKKGGCCQKAWNEWLHCNSKTIKSLLN